MELARPARAEDLSRCSELATEAVEAIKADPVGHRSWSVRRHRHDDVFVDLDRIPIQIEVHHLDRRDLIVLAGSFAGAVIGVAIAHVVPATAGAWQAFGEVDLCYVEPPARQVGVGTALLEGLLDGLRLRGCTHVDAEALPGDRNTKRLYEAAGLKARLLILHRSLEPPPPAP